MVNLLCSIKKVKGAIFYSYVVKENFTVRIGSKMFLRENKKYGRLYGV